MLLLVGISNCARSQTQLAVQILEPPLKEDPTYGTFFTMLSKPYIPRHVVEQKMRVAGLDPAILDLDPEKPLPSASSGPANMFDTVELNEAESADEIRKRKECEDLKSNLADPARETKAQEGRARLQAKWNNPTCPTGITVEFLRTDSFEESLEHAIDGEATLLAFDLDGTLAEMKGHDTSNTLKLFKDVEAFEKVVVTAAEATRGNCETVLSQLAMPADGDATNEFVKVFGVPPKGSCVMRHVLNKDGTAQDRQMALAPRIAMNRYEKAAGLLSYLMPQTRSELFGDSEAMHHRTPEHVMFYDDFVANPINFADHFCNIEAPVGLKKLTSIWYATAEAEDRERRIEAKLKEKVKTCDVDMRNFKSEGSYFHPDVQENAELSWQRAVFGVL